MITDLDNLAISLQLNTVQTKWLETKVEALINEQVLAVLDSIKLPKVVYELDEVRERNEKSDLNNRVQQTMLDESRGYINGVRLSETAVAKVRAKYSSQFPGVDV